MGRRVKDNLAALLGDLELEKRYLEGREADGQTVVRGGPKDTVLDLLSAVNALHRDLVKVPQESEIRESIEGSGHLYNTRSHFSCGQGNPPHGRTSWDCAT
jgi:hypothetical protein